MSRIIVLVAAPDTGLRHSLEFALASALFETDAHDYVTAAFASPHADQAACAVVDEYAVENWQEAPRQFERFARPVILLVGILGTVPNLPLLRPLTKPFLGEPLLEAVRSATGAF